MNQLTARKTPPVPSLSRQAPPKPPTIASSRALSPQPQTITEKKIEVSEDINTQEVMIKKRIAPTIPVSQTNSIPPQNIDQSRKIEEKITQTASASAPDSVSTSAQAQAQTSTSTLASASTQTLASVQTSASAPAPTSTLAPTPVQKIKEQFISSIPSTPITITNQTLSKDNELYINTLLDNFMSTLSPSITEQTQSTQKTPTHQDTTTIEPHIQQQTTQEETAQIPNTIIAQSPNDTVITEPETLINEADTITNESEAVISEEKTIKNEDVIISSFSHQIEADLFDAFGKEIMSMFITDDDRIGAAYVIMQSVINTYTQSHNLPDIRHSLLPSQLDNGMNEEIINIIISDLHNYYAIFYNTPDFEAKKEIYKIPELSTIDASNKESIITFIISFFRLISAGDNYKQASDTTSTANTPYESDMIEINKSRKHKMWQLAKEIQEAIKERNEIIDEIAIPIIKRGYPIDARKMAANFLRESKRNHEVAMNALFNNPANFAPIIIDKLPRKFFGLVRPNKKDAIEINKSLGRFLKKIVH